ncbi:type II toxin-antitoxin system VapC family toxin [Flavobacterium sp. DGU11]|uniref:Type II toxin-antitoxin system VapC family toxin n=1 Tax=Flavobacterium arundinis TaxID=3139143 RepID=A0ABU9HVV3_9FLAO
MGQEYLIDTNVISGYFSELFSENSLDFLDIVTNLIPNISVITEIEILSWKTSTDVEDVVRDFVSDGIVFGITPEIVEISVNIRRRKNIKTPDAIIAATAVANNFTLITSNEKDFRNIKGLKIINPYKL